MNHPTLYHKGKGGALYQWRVWTESNRIFTEYGQVGGKLQISEPTVCESKNVGRSNQTTPEQQAELEAAAMYKFKLDRKYSETPEAAQEQLMLPMLAHEFGKKAKKLVYPIDVQPKLDGLRCMAVPDGNRVRLISRQGKDYNVPVVAEQLQTFRSFWPNDDWMLDGELYVHGVGFQTLTSWVKKLRPETARLEYHIYDVPAWNGFDNYPWGERVNLLGHLGKVITEYGFTNLKPIDTIMAGNEEEVMFWQKHFVERGYEGVMARDRRGLYLFGYRSSELLKVKTFVDHEFPIFDFTSGDGKFADCVIWKCRTQIGIPFPDGKGGTFTPGTSDVREFDVVPVGTMEQRREWFRNGQTFIGKMLKCKYFELTDDFKPRFPVGLGIRIPEDMDPVSAPVPVQPNVIDTHSGQTDLWNL